MRLVSACAASLVLAAAAVAFAQTATYSGYAYPDCSPADGRAVRVVLVQGAVPAGIPDRMPRPSIDVLVNADMDTAIAHPIAIAPEAVPANAVARSCPVVGSCAAAKSGTLSLMRGADGALTGAFKAQWGNTPEREGKFSIEWRDRTVSCG